jgi:mannitol-1-/sugar-/sorbitol-6-phosphatase
MPPASQEIMTQIRCSALLFDMDGVLIDSTPAVTRVWRNWALAHGLNPEKVVARAHGRPSLTTVREFLPDVDHERENRIVERLEMDDLEGVVPLPGARELLERLPEDRWTIVTSCTRSLAVVRLRAAGLSIPGRFVTSTDVTNGKPHPEPYLRAANLLGYPATDCVVLEDVPAGIQAGRAAGARVIALRTTCGAPDLTAAGANWVLKNCSEIEIAQQQPELRLDLADHG